MTGEITGHDWLHAYRVRKNALKISETEGPVDLFVIHLASLLHDVADWKFCGGDEEAGSRLAREWLVGMSIESSVVESVCEIIDYISFKGAGVTTRMKSKEGMIVQDADRLDAMGAIGMARAFAYGGHVGRELYDPN